MSFWIREIGSDNAEGLRHVARNMREWDRREIFATRWDDDPDTFAAEVQETLGLKRLVGWGDEPIAAVGAVPLWQGVWSIWMFGTDKFPRIGLSLTKWVRRVMMPTLIEDRGCHRAQCVSIEGHVDAQRWLESLDVRREHPLPDFGRNRELFWSYAWRRP